MTGDSKQAHEGLTFTKGSSWRIRSALEKIFLVVIIILLILSIVFIILYATKSTKDNSNNDDVCTSRNCIISAGFMANKMDPTVDPCVNFADYACGGYYKDAVIPSDKVSIGSFVEIQETNFEVSKGIIQSPMSDDDAEYLVKAKNYYTSCFDQEHIDKRGIKPYLASSFSKDWPTVNPNWDESAFNLTEVMIKHANHGYKPLVTTAVTTDMRDSTRNTVYVSQPDDIISSRYLTGARNGSVVMALQDFYVGMAMEIGADNETAEEDAKDFIDLLVKLAKIKTTPEERMNITAIYTSTTLKELSRTYKTIKYYEFLNTQFQSIGVTLQEDQHIVVFGPKYISQVEAVIDQTSPRTLQNLFGFNYANKALDSLTTNLRALNFKFDKVVKGTTQNVPRWKECVEKSLSVFSKGLGKEYVKQKFPEKSKTYVNKMIDALAYAFSEVLDDADWMEPTTKKEARLKLQSLGRKIGFPDSNFTDSDINRFYDKITIEKEKYFENKLSIFQFAQTINLALLGKPVDRTSWGMAAYKVNAYYNPSLNDIAFPAGILQPPFFSDKFPDSLNFGAIGTVIGHEITHGFDLSGSQFDHKGDLRNWWQPKDMQSFLSKIKCLVNQYANFEDPQVKMKINGIVSVGENTADMGGVKQAFRAYKHFSQGKTSEKPLPGLGLRLEQQFFLAFGQLWCQRQRDQSLRDGILTSEHPPGRFRIIGALQNNVDFAKVFNCPAGSFMNPETKCSVW